MVAVKTICISIGTFLVVNPLTASFYVSAVGNALGIDVVNEAGMVKNLKTKKLLRYDTKIKFVEDLSNAGSLPWLLLGGPFLTPYSFYFMVKSTYNAINYSLYYKKKVENGEFDREDYGLRR